MRFLNFWYNYFPAETVSVKTVYVTVCAAVNYVRCSNMAAFVPWIIWTTDKRVIGKSGPNYTKYYQLWYFKHDDETRKEMERALAAVKDGLCVNGAEWRFNIPKTTLKRRVSGKLISWNVSAGHPKDLGLAAEVENNFVRHFLQLEEMF